MIPAHHGLIGSRASSGGNFFATQSVRVGRRFARAVNGTLKTYPGYPHGMPVTHPDVLNPDLLAFIQS